MHSCGALPHGDDPERTWVREAGGDPLPTLRGQQPPRTLQTLQHKSSPADRVDLSKTRQPGGTGPSSMPTSDPLKPPGSAEISHQRHRLSRGRAPPEHPDEAATRFHVVAKIRGSRIAVVGVLLLLPIVGALAVFLGAPDTWSNAQWGAALAGCAAVFIVILLLGLLWVFDFAADQIPGGSRLFAVLVLDLVIIAVAMAAAWKTRAVDAHLAWLSGMIGALTVVTFFGMLWSQKTISGKATIRSAIAATVTVIYFSLAGLFLFDIDLLDEPTAEASDTDAPDSSDGDGACLEGTDPPCPADESKAEPTGSSDEESEPAKTTRDIFGDITKAFLAVIAFYFASVTAENVSIDRTKTAAIKEGNLEALKELTGDQSNEPAGDDG